MALAPSTARIRQKRRQRLILALLLLLLLLGGAAYWLLKPSAQPVEEVRPKGTVAVPMLARDVRMGDMVNMSLVRLRYFKPYEVPGDALLKPWQFNQRIALRNLRGGEHLREMDLAPIGAPNGFSGLTRQGNRIVVVSTASISGALGYLREGDHVDVLAIGMTGTAVAAASRPSGSHNTRAGGGSQPGAGGTPKQDAKPTAATTDVPLLQATLVAEDAVVMLTPKKGIDTNYAVLQMKPQDAHVTTLALAIGSNLRFVFRPFNDAERITPEKDLTKTTYLPRPDKPERRQGEVDIIQGATRTIQTTMYER